MSNSLKILQANISNFKNITAKEIRIDGRSLVVIGGNAVGKSSFIQALLSPLDSQYIPAKTIKEGEERGSIKLLIGGEMDGLPKKYNIDIFFTPGNQSGRLVVTNELGEEMKPAKTFLKGLVGNIGFDVFQFLKSKPKEQVEQLKKIAGLDFGKINLERQKVYDERTYINKKIQEEEAQLKNHGYSDADIGKYSARIDVAPVKQKITDLGKAIQDYSNVEAGINSRQEKYNNNIERCASIDREIIELMRKIEKLKTEAAEKAAENNQLTVDIGKGKTWLAGNTKPDITKLNEELSAAEEHNRHYEKLEQFKAKNIELNAMKAKSESYSDKIKEIDKNKEDMISNSKLPVAGLTFTDESPLYNGLPLEDGQINKAKLIEIGARIGMAMNPTLRIIFVNDASLLDKNSLKALIELCESEGYQLFLEIVDFSGESELEVKFTEDFLIN